MKITSGLFDNMVMQRVSRGVSAQRFCGECAGQGRVLCTVKRGGKRVKGFAVSTVGHAAGSSFQGLLKGLGAGGPYTVELAVADGNGKQSERLTVRNVLVGDVWVLAGQSNMEGIGHIEHALKPMAMTRAFYMNDTWDIARDRLHVLADAVDEAHAIIAGGPPGPPAAHVGVGPGVGFLQQMYRLTKIPQGAIACAHGGTSMMQWDPKKKDEGGKSLYGATLRRIRKNGGSVAGVFWYQGCSDADEYAGPLYTGRMSALVEALRGDLDDTSIPWVVVQIAGVCGDPLGSRHWNFIQDQQRLLPEKIRRLAVVPAIDLAMDDNIHLAGFEQNRLGRRAANAMACLTGRVSGCKPQIALKSVKVMRNKKTGAADVVVTFDKVQGKLVSNGRPWGFELAERIGEQHAEYVYRTDLDGSRAVLHTISTVPEIESTFLYYGMGRRPYCNITDAADRSLPVFGPVYLGGSRVYAPFITKMLVSRFMPSAGRLHGLAYPADKDALGLEVRQFGGTFCDRHPEILNAKVDDLLVYYAAQVRCTEPMDVEIWLGYDGPVKMWVDREEKLFDPDGVNPSLPDDSCTGVRFDAGVHEILVALGSNNLKAWGIFLRLVRTGMPLDLIMKGPEAYGVPENAIK